MRFSQAFLLFIVLVSKISFCLSQGRGQDLEVNVRFANRTQIPWQQTPTIVEVSIGDNGTWVKVQTNGRDRKVGSVICRQLGQGPVFNAVTVMADSGMNYYTVICEGTEASLKDCSIKTKTSSDYTHPLFLYVQCLPPHAQELEVFLIKGQQYLTEGVVFIYVGGSWGPICAQEYNSKPSLCDIMCHELGYQRCNNWVQVPEGEVFSEPVITDLQCRVGARSLQECTFESTRSCPTLRSNFGDWGLSGSLPATIGT
ncbi:putative deleted in malignant brain tumors 1 protein-like [Apostichopus japonicus]|uniref:Putative deleted in malignant brain tumors 1 protein-like n=1 Tax=Stichopus japonicus TaxID=307972 RepID=A0A2G8KQN6_STIJA|nr:putative deleted in malignant brain tumors 1 protein-like [Apostichopus japonicus]